jgi:hypothetical protein
MDSEENFYSLIISQESERLLREEPKRLKNTYVPLVSPFTGETEVVTVTTPCALELDKKLRKTSFESKMDLFKALRSGKVKSGVVIEKAVDTHGGRVRVQRQPYIYETAYGSYLSPLYRVYSGPVKSYRNCVFEIESSEPKDSKFFSKNLNTGEWEWIPSKYLEYIAPLEVKSVGRF